MDDIWGDLFNHAKGVTVELDKESVSEKVPRKELDARCSSALQEWIEKKDEFNKNSQFRLARTEIQSLWDEIDNRGQ